MLVVYDVLFHRKAHARAGPWWPVLMSIGHVSRNFHRDGNLKEMMASIGSRLFTVEMN